MIGFGIEKVERRVGFKVRNINMWFIWVLKIIEESGGDKR